MVLVLFGLKCIVLLDGIFKCILCVKVWLNLRVLLVLKKW